MQHHQHRVHRVRRHLRHVGASVDVRHELRRDRLQCLVYELEDRSKQLRLLRQRMSDARQRAAHLRRRVRRLGRPLRRDVQQRLHALRPGVRE